MDETTQISQQAHRSGTRAHREPGASADGGSRHVLVVTEPSGADAGAKAARAAVVVAHAWADAFGADVATLELSETRDRHHWTLGARSHRLAEEIVAAAEARDADVIVLGIDRRRIARRHIAPSLRAQLTRETALPVLVAPASEPVTEDSDARDDGAPHARSATRGTEATGPASKARDAGPYAHV